MNILRLVRRIYVFYSKAKAGLGLEILENEWWEKLEHMNHKTNLKYGRMIHA